MCIDTHNIHIYIYICTFLHVCTPPCKHDVHVFLWVIHEWSRSLEWCSFLLWVPFEWDKSLLYITIIHSYSMHISNRTHSSLPRFLSLVQARVRACCLSLSIPLSLLPSPLPLSLSNAHTHTLSVSRGAKNTERRQTYRKEKINKTYPNGHARLIQSRWSCASLPVEGRILPRLHEWWTWGGDDSQEHHRRLLNWRPPHYLRSQSTHEPRNSALNQGPDRICIYIVDCQIMTPHSLMQHMSESEVCTHVVSTCASEVLEMGSKMMIIHFESQSNGDRRLCSFCFPRSLALVVSPGVSIELAWEFNWQFLTEAPRPFWNH